MTSAAFYELLGFIASGLIVVSITQKSILRIRIIGLLGSLTFLAYGVLIVAYPIVLVNGAATMIHLWYLRQLTTRRSEVFTVLPVRAESQYLAAFLDHYGEEIAERFQPEFYYEQDPENIVVFVLRDIVPAGLFIGRRNGDGGVQVFLDFATPEYRDLRIANFLYSDESGFFEATDHELVAEASAPEHVNYLRRVGFQNDPGSQTTFRRPIRMGS